MIVRLFLALLLALGAMPGAAMPGCHGPATAAMAPMAMPAADGARHDRQPVAAEHGCIGCAALPDWLAERVAAPLPVSAAGIRPPTMRALPRVAGPPDLRPPRIG